MLAPETPRQLEYLAPGERDLVREHAKERLVALGRPVRSNRKGA
ncbi:hypothetical protein [Methylobacterium currus]|nr:hypothetical protein [Methylobacterium currus]